MIPPLAAFKARGYHARIAAAMNGAKPERGQAKEAVMRSRGLPLLAAVLALVAATSGASAMSTHFSWYGIPACETLSPVFALNGVPPGTKRLRFTMHDLNVPGFHHDGSTIVYAGDAVKRGAIHYIGPCPPRGQRHRYRWTIESLDGAGKVTTTVTETFPP
jgi:Phosphatidylethanolamine-binding protein